MGVLVLHDALLLLAGRMSGCADQRAFTRLPNLAAAADLAMTRGQAVILGTFLRLEPHVSRKVLLASWQGLSAFNMCSVNL